MELYIYRRKRKTAQKRIILPHRKKISRKKEIKSYFVACKNEKSRS